MSGSIATLDLSLYRPFVLRTLPLWLIFHVALAWMSGGATLVLSPLATGGLAAIAAIVGLIDARRRHELLFLRNLGFGPATIASTCAMTIVLAEVIAAMLAASLGTLH